MLEPVGGGWGGGGWDGGWDGMGDGRDGKGPFKVPCGWELGVTLTETQIPHHISDRSLNLVGDTYKNIEKIC